MPSDIKAATLQGPPIAPARTFLPNRKLLLRRALFLLLPLALIAAIPFYVSGGRVMTTDNAYIEADKVGISTDIAGVVAKVEVADNQHVEAGQVLYRLEERPYRLALQRADAQIGIVRNEIEALKANYGEIQAQIAQARDDVAFYDREFNRQKVLEEAHVVSQANFDAARRNLRNAQTKLSSLERQSAGVQANLSGDPEIPDERHPRYAEAVAQRDEAARQLEHTVVKAPFAGIVTNVPALAPGKYIQASATAFYLVAADHAWIESNPKETELTYVRAGQPATITVDAYPGVEWHGTVESISPAAAQEFALLPAQNTSGNWVKIVQRIPLRVRIDTNDPNLPPLRSGMSVELNIDTGHPRGWPHIL